MKRVGYFLGAIFDRLARRMLWSAYGLRLPVAGVRLDNAIKNLMFAMEERDEAERSWRAWNERVKAAQKEVQSIESRYGEPIREQEAIHE